ncbi:MAG: HepT-like ribonuclease domain-containing protein [Actinomycetota bacterium]
MKPLEVRKYLFDILQACELLVRFTEGKTLAEYLQDPMMRSAVERQFEIVGEALAGALRIDPSVASAVSDAHRVVAFRNRLIHGYAFVSDEVVWGVLENNLSTLRHEVATLLGTPGQDE